MVSLHKSIYISIAQRKTLISVETKAKIDGRNERKSAHRDVKQNSGEEEDEEKKTNRQDE